MTPDGTVSPLNLDKIANAAVTLPNPPEDKEVRGPSWKIQRALELDHRPGIHGRTGLGCRIGGW